ncbi:MAG: hypothetical protein ACRC3H_12550 [Lachnospiraceae bacterium]
MSKNSSKKPMTVVKKMMIALIGGLVVGLAFLLIREQLTAAGNDSTWTIINKILFQDITTGEGVGAVVSSISSVRFLCAACSLLLYL